MPVTVQITEDKNPKQVQFFNVALEAVYGDNPYRYLWYGGAIRGGKTFVELALLVIFCKLFPGSRWHVMRKSFDRLLKTTLPSMYKILGRAARVKWNRDEGNYYVEFLSTGSRIYFVSENFKQDPNLTWMLGVETNGWLLEQVEELQRFTLDMAITRLGSWYVDPMPMPIIMGSFNPTLTWIKQMVYDLWAEGQLEPPHFFIQALPDDNAWVTQAQWDAWSHLPPELRAQFIEANWDFVKPPNRFAYAFDEKAHHLDCGYSPDWPLYVSYDFNVEPIVCLLEQHDDHWNFSHTFKEYRLLNSDIWELNDHLITNHADAFFQITGDASGQNRTALKKNLTYYKVIKQQLILAPNQIKVPRANPSVRNTRVLCNSMLSRHPDCKINTKACPHLTLDLNGVVVDDNGDIDKAKDKRMTHLLDAWRYQNWTWHRDFIDKSLYQYLEND
jgi:hypothetical protein